VIAVAAVVALTATNVCGMAFGKQVQNVLSVAKIVALLAIIVAGFSVPDAGSVRDGSAAVVRSQDIAVAPEDERNEFRSTEAVTLAQVGVALVLILYAYGGWGDAVFVAAEVRNLQRNVPRALLLGMGGITLLYVGVNAAYLAALGLDGLRSATTPASDVLQLAWGPAGGRSIGLIVMLSALGAINGMLFAGSRVVMSMGEDYRLLSVLGGWDPRRRAPVPALIALGLMSVLLVVLVGTETGHRAWNAVLSSAGLTGMKWDPRSGGFEMLIVSMSPTFWALFVLTAVAVVVLRAKDARRPRPFRIPLYPLPPILFGLTSAYMLYSSAAYAQALNLIGVVPLAVGLVLYAVSAHPSGAGRGE
jgi:amino acid transporter